MRALAILTLGLCVSFATASLADSISGNWNVTLSGAVASTCVASVQRSGNTVTGALVCREAGFKLPIQAKVQGNRVVNTATKGDAGWTATLDASTGSGTYMSPMGAGSWTAERE